VATVSTPFVCSGSFDFAHADADVVEAALLVDWEDEPHAPTSAAHTAHASMVLIAWIRGKRRNVQRIDGALFVIPARSRGTI
jgi:hypothetical protein